LNFYGDKAFFGKFMVVRVRLWSNTNLERGEAPIGQIPVWADGESKTFCSFQEKEGASVTLSSKSCRQHGCHLDRRCYQRINIIINVVIGTSRTIRPNLSP
jgi:hypothetical protein